MTEQGQIQYYINGEKPSKGYQIIRVRNINNAVLVILKNKSLNDEDPKWEKLLPQGIVSKLNQLDSDNKKYDEFLVDVDMSIYNFQDIKDWEWYSSLEVDKGFDIIVKGDFNPAHFISFIHCQNVPLEDIRIIDVDKNKSYELKTFKDYTTYKILN